MTLDSPQWIAAKAEGDRAELAIAGWFRQRGWQTYKTLGQVDFDLLLQCKVEVKSNPKALETGNPQVRGGAAYALCIANGIPDPEGYAYERYRKLDLKGLTDRVFWLFYRVRRKIIEGLFTAYIRRGG